MHTNKQENDEPLLNNPNTNLGSPTYGTGAKLNDKSVPHSRSNLIETEDVSFFGMVGWLLWKNYKSQFQRRKKSWIVKMLLPVIFTLILGALRTAFTTDNVDAEYGDETTNLSFGDYNIRHLSYSLNQPFAISPFTARSDLFINLPLCVNNWTGPAPFVSVVKPTSPTNAHIEAVMDIMKSRWSFQGEADQEFIATHGCLEYATQLPFEEGWLLKFFDSNSAVDSYCKEADYGKGWSVVNNSASDEMKNRPIAFGISFKEPSEDGLTWSYELRFNASGDSAASQQGGQGEPSPFEGTTFPVPSTSQPNVNNFNRKLSTQWTAGTGNYYYSFFIHLQNYVDAAITEYVAQQTGIPNPEATLAEINNMTRGFFVFPTPAYQADDFWLTITGLFVFFILIAFVYPYSQIVKALVGEKAAKIKEGMKMMGATFSTFWVS
eukprot:80231_1